jgi:tRNA A37 methylthiotransferase MiaB
VVPYFDISFQHASGPLLRSMRRFGDRESFLALLEDVRRRAPHAGIRSNVIVGFPGETEADLDELEAFLVAARLDVVGVFGYSDEDGTEAEGYGDKLPEDVVAERVSRFTSLVEELNVQRAEERIGEVVEVLVEELPGDDADADVDGDDDGDDTAYLVGRAAHQGPDVDGVTLIDPALAPGVAVGDLVRATVVGTNGIDLVAEPC